MAHTSEGLEPFVGNQSLPEVYRTEALPEVYQDEEDKDPAASGSSLVEQQAQRKPTPSILGLSPTLFAVTVALLTAIVVGGAVGGGVGSALPHKPTATITHTITSTQTVTPTPTIPTTTNGQFVNVSVPVATSVYSVNFTCPSNALHTSFNGQTWIIDCTESLQNGDIGGTIAYTYQDCVHACAAVNWFRGNDSACVALQFAQMMSSKVSINHANCWLKDSSWQVGNLEAGLNAKLLVG